MKRCAVYTRVSTSMQAEVEYNSCEAQRDKILSYIKSQEDLELFREYSDPGFSGSNLERPSLTDLLRDISEKNVDVVLTYKIDRLTRSSKDFYTLIEFFEKFGVTYVSVSERFDTSSASGRLLRNIMLTFAQFEREMGAERTKDKMLQRAQKGMWNGGYCPVGYKRKEGKLLVDKERAKIVREAFEVFVLTGSLMKAVAFVRDSKMISPMTGNLYTIPGIACILRNPVYAGKVLWSKNIYDGLHEPIISKELFEKAQSLTKEKVIKKRVYKDFLLTGLVKCTECGSSMTNTYTNKKERRYYYYKCYKVMREGKKACSIKEVNAEKLERFLIENLSRIAQDNHYIESLTFKMLHNSGGRAGIELTEVWSKNVATRVSEVLIDFKNKIEKATQVEKCLLFEKTISRINFSRKSLEVIISLTDTSSPFSDGQNGLMGCRSAAGIRAGAPNPFASAQVGSSILKNGAEGQNRTAHACLFRAALYH